MFPEFNRVKFKRHFLNVSQTNRIALGFTERDFPLNDLSEYFVNARVAELKQIHSDKIYCSSEIKGNSSGDGIILDSRTIMAVIKTADCVPLFFWNRKYSCAGIIHCGWRGLQKTIERKLIDMLVEKGNELHTLNFYLGPAIETACYSVGPELKELFQAREYINQIFTARKDGGFHLDLKKALFLSLIEKGIPPQNIMDSRLCTFCEKHRFPSFRREGKTKKRIYNFVILK